MMPALVAGSRFPVGSSASRMAGLLTTARAIATRCCSPPESSCGKRLDLPARPTILSTSGTASWMKPRDLPITCSVNATLSKTVLFGSSRKSWKTTPRLRRKYGTLRFESVLSCWPSTWIWPVRRLLLLEHEAQEARLAGAGGADEEDELALEDLEAHRVERGPRVARVRLGDRVEANHGVSLRRQLRSARQATRGSPGFSGSSAGPYSVSRLRHLMPALMKPSRSPSKTFEGLSTSYSVRRSLTIWYGAST